MARNPELTYIPESSYDRAANTVHRVHSELYWAFHPTQEYDYNVQLAIQKMLMDYVAPHSVPNPDVFLVGMGQRAEEISATLFSLQPSRITVSDSRPDGIVRGRKRWNKFFREQPRITKSIYRGKISLNGKDFLKDPDKHDIIMAFSIDPGLQGKEQLHELISKSEGLTIITAHQTDDPFDSVRWERPHGYISEAQNIDEHLSEIGGIDILTRMQPLDMGTPDGHLWVLGRNNEFIDPPPRVYERGIKIVSSDGTVTKTLQKMRNIGNILLTIEPRMVYKYS